MVLKVKSEVESFLRLSEARGRFYLNRKGVNASVCVPQDKEVGMGTVVSIIYGSVDGDVESDDECY